jgi:hypothetical protein
MVWIKSRWKVKGDISLKLGSKGFFTMIFTCSEDRNKVFDEGPYFFNSTGLHLRYWSECFSQRKKTLQPPQFGSDFTLYLMSFGIWKPWKE